MTMPRREGPPWLVWPSRANSQRWALYSDVLHCITLYRVADVRFHLIRVTLRLSQYSGGVQAGLRKFNWELNESPPHVRKAGPRGDGESNNKLIGARRLRALADADAPRSIRIRARCIGRPRLAGKRRAAPQRPLPR